MKSHPVKLARYSTLSRQICIIQSPIFERRVHVSRDHIYETIAQAPGAYAQLMLHARMRSYAPSGRRRGSARLWQNRR